MANSNKKLIATLHFINGDTVDKVFTEIDNPNTPGTHDQYRSWYTEQKRNGFIYKTGNVLGGEYPFHALIHVTFKQG